LKGVLGEIFGTIVTKGFAVATASSIVSTSERREVEIKYCTSLGTKKGFWGWQRGFNSPGFGECGVLDRGCGNIHVTHDYSAHMCEILRVQ